MARFVRSIQRWIPLTSAGLVTAVLCIAALRFGLGRQDLILTLAGAWGLGLLGVSGLSAYLSMLAFRRRLRISVATSGAGFVNTVVDRPTTTGARFRRSFRPLVRRPVWWWKHPHAEVLPQVRGLELAEIVRPSERGISQQIVRVFEVADVFGLWRFVGTVAQARPVLIKPDTGALTSAELSRCLAYGDLLPYPFGKTKGDRVDSRPYTRSDPARMILWKVYARTRELMVRVPEPARAPESRPVVYLVASPGDAAAAGVARLIMEDELFGAGTRFACDGHPQPTTDPDEIVQAISSSIEHRARSAHDLQTTLSSSDVSSDDPFVIVCAAVAGSWQAALVGTLQRDPARFVVLAAGDVHGARPAETGLRRWLFKPLPSAGTNMRSMIAACRPIVSTGVRVSLVDRRNGRVLPLGAQDDSAPAYERSA